MATIIGFDTFYNAKKAIVKEQIIRKGIEELEKKLGLEDDPLLVLSDELAMTIGDNLLDVRNAINNVLDILGIDEISDISEINLDKE